MDERRGTCLRSPDSYEGQSPSAQKSGRPTQEPVCPERGDRKRGRNARTPAHVCLSLTQKFWRTERRRQEEAKETLSWSKNPCSQPRTGRWKPLERQNPRDEQRDAEKVHAQMRRQSTRFLMGMPSIWGTRIIYDGDRCQHGVPK
jgi:hypothetical protein